MNIISIDNTSTLPVFRLRSADGQATDNLATISHEEMPAITTWLGQNGSKRLVDSFELAMINAGLVRIIPKDRDGVPLRFHKCEAIEVRHDAGESCLLWQPTITCTSCGGVGHFASDGDEIDITDTCGNCDGDGRDEGETFWTDAEGTFVAEDARPDYYGPTRLAKTRDEFAVQMTMHCPPLRPHWSESAEWRHDRWDTMVNAPWRGRILEVRGKTADGRIIDRMHFAEGGGEEQPPFRGWFAPYPTRSSGFYQVSPVAWQPLRATYDPQEGATTVGKNLS